MAEELADLVRRRGSAKAALTRMEGALGALIDDTVTVVDLHIRLEHLEKIFTNFSDLDDDIEARGSPSELREFERRYFDVKSKLRNAVKKITDRINQDQLNFSIGKLTEHQKELVEELHNTSFSQKLRDDVKLPKINIQPFSGDFAQFPTFKDLYEVSIHKTSISDVHKFKYLRGLLTGEAASLITNIPITSANYKDAWEKICKRYDNVTHISTTLLDKFFAQPHSKGDPRKLRMLADVTDEILRALKALGDEAERKDVWLIYMLLDRCDDKTRQTWALETSDGTFPTIEKFLNFLTNRSFALERSKPTRNDTGSSGSKQRPLSLQISREDSQGNISCPCCSADHYLFNCNKFIKMMPKDRRIFVAEKKLCFVCMKSCHSAFQCRSKHRCGLCKRKHNTLLHLAESATSNSGEDNLEDANKKAEVQNFNTKLMETSTIHDNIVPEDSASGRVMLPTALVYLKDGLGKLYKCKALLDTGSEASFIDEMVVRKLNLSRKAARVVVSGLATANIVTRGITTLTLLSRQGNNVISTDAFILAKLPINIQPINTNLDEVNKLDLADPTFSTSAKIDILLGADVFFKILQDGRLQFPNFIAQNTLFGYILAGSGRRENGLQNLNVSLSENVDRVLNKFWELEEIKEETIYSKEEVEIERHFQDNFSRNSDGRFIVKLPMKTKEAVMSESVNCAIKRLTSIERRFLSNQNLKTEYCKFLKEYESLGHMEMVTSEIGNSQGFYLPHHAVIKTSSSTTKVRVVFDGSCSNSSGISLNNMLMVGPTIQPTLWEILLRFRSHRYAITADIEKMYRQILVAKEDRKYQRIVWREHQNEKIQHYELNTVTYGTASAPYLATRCLNQLGYDIRNTEPKISKVIINDFYVDDLLTGAETISELLHIKNRVHNTLLSAGFALRKWVTNGEIANNQGDVEIDECDPDVIKILGIKWNPVSDSFSFKVNIEPDREVTKRKMLSEISRIFDPLGWLAPSIIITKILLQRLWLQKLSWDEQVNAEISHIWNKFRNELEVFESFKIPRFVPHAGLIEFHGFADASEQAYSAVIYCKSTNQNVSQVNLITCKTKVAPIKQVSLPRLELCAAQLLAKLISKVSKSMGYSHYELFTWTDSTIVLAWLSSHPSKWKTFVGNRTSEILSLVPRERWNHVKSSENPADLATRGISPAKLLDESLWWKGPRWLHLPESRWPSQLKPTTTTEEVRSKTKQLFQIGTEPSADSNNIYNYLISKFSCYTKIIRILAYVNRFIHNLLKAREKLNYTFLTAKELEMSRQLCIKWDQERDFEDDLKRIKNKSTLSRRSKLIKLCPFVDDDGLLRVGGRLTNSNCAYNTKHPYILSKTSPLGKILILDTHKKFLHPGPSLTSFLLRQNFWIIDSRNSIKKLLNQCIVCVRYKTTHQNQKMGDLPSERVCESRPFSNVGIDYAGPIMMATKRGRGAKLIKTYIAIFVCFSTKALHLELVGDCTSEAFIAALRRFIARRGIPKNIYSDNGTNFVGAENKLKKLATKAVIKLDEIGKMVTNSEFLKDVAEFLSQNGTTWHFNPPVTPHFGGLWEAAVKSVKKHLVREAGKTHLTMEELSTLLCQIEAILNSRPLCPMSADDSSFVALTPAHFLVGEPMLTIPDGQYAMEDENPINYWDKIQQRVKMFWKRYHVEYLNNLQQRHKAQQNSDNIKTGELVLLKDDNLPPCHWAMGIIAAVHPGGDGLVRIVTIKTQKNTFKRHISKLVKLPVY